MVCFKHANTGLSADRQRYEGCVLATRLRYLIHIHFAFDLHAYVLGFDRVPASIDSRLEKGQQIRGLKTGAIGTPIEATFTRVLKEVLMWGDLCHFVPAP
jgi:hypothetical protein